MGIDWGIIFVKHPYACYDLYKWTCRKFYQRAMSMAYFNEEMFHACLVQNGYHDNISGVLEFFDENIIQCSIMADGYKKFVATAISEFRGFVCRDHNNRLHATIATIENAFYLLEERINHLKKKQDDWIKYINGSKAGNL